MYCKLDCKTSTFSVFAPCNKPIMANRLLLTNLERFLRRINSPLTRYKREIYRALIVPNWPKWQSLGAQTIMPKTIQPLENSDNLAKNIPTHFSLRQFSQFYKTLDSKEKIRIGAMSRFKVAGGRATRASPLSGDNPLTIS